MSDTYYYVNNTGSGSGAGTEADPYTTAQLTGVTSFETGDHVLFYHSDVYNLMELVIDAYGTAAKPVVFGKYGGSDKPVIHYTGDSDSIILNTGIYCDFVSLEVNAETGQSAFKHSGDMTEMRWFDVDCSGVGRFFWQANNTFVTGTFYGGHWQYSTRDMWSVNGGQWYLYGSEINHAGFSTAGVINWALAEGDGVTMHDTAHLHAEDISVRHCKRSLSNVQEQGYTGTFIRCHIDQRRDGTGNVEIEHHPILQYQGGTTVLQSCVVAASGGYAAYMMHTLNTGRIYAYNCGFYDQMNNGLAGTYVNQGHMKLYNNVFRIEPNVVRAVNLEAGISFTGQDNVYDWTGDESHAVWQAGTETWATWAAREDNSRFSGDMITPNWWVEPEHARVLQGSPLITGGQNLSETLHFDYHNNPRPLIGVWSVGPFMYPYELNQTPIGVGGYDRHGYAPN